MMWERQGLGREQLTSRDVLVIDEAGMVGTRQLERVLSEAANAGAKVVLVGESWHWPEAMASGMLDEVSGWEAGSRLIRADDPQAWSAVVEAARMAQANRQIISGCIKKANAAGKPVRCIISVVPNSE